MAEVAKYCEIRRVLRILKDIAKRKIYGEEFFGESEKEVRDFGMYITALTVFPELRDIEELKRCQQAVSLHLSKKTFLDGFVNAHAAYEMIERNLSEAIAKTEEFCKGLKPYRNKPNKDLVVRSIRRYKEIERASTNEPEKIAHGYELLGKLKSLVPGLEAEDVFVEAEDAIGSGYSKATNADLRAILLKNQIGGVVGKVMSEYEITEDEIEKSEEVIKLTELIADLRKDSLGRGTPGQRPKPPAPKEVVLKIRSMLGSFTSSDVIALELRDLAADLIGTWGDTDMGTRIMETYLDIGKNISPDASIKGSLYETKVISLLNEVEKRQERYIGAA